MTTSEDKPPLVNGSVNSETSNSSHSDHATLPAKTLQRCQDRHICRGDILKALNHNSDVTEGGILVTDITGVIKQLASRKSFLAPGATLGFPPDVVEALITSIETCDHRSNFPISRGEILMTINGHSKLNRSENIIETNIQGVVDTLKSLNRPLTPQSFLPIGFQSGLQGALLREISFIKDPYMQFRRLPPPPPTFPEPPPLPPKDQI